MSCEKTCGVGGKNNKTAKNKKPGVRMHVALLWLEFLVSTAQPLKIAEKFYEWLPVQIRIVVSD
jgi:hypothetical protein